MNISLKTFLVIISATLTLFAPPNSNSTVAKEYPVPLVVTPEQVAMPLDAVTIAPDAIAIQSTGVAIPAGAVAIEPRFAPAPEVMSTDCGCQSCGCSSCQPAAPCATCQRRGCRLGKSCGRGCAKPLRAKRGCRKCPQCSGDVCQLEVKAGEVEKTCFKTEQKVVCIPKVRMPWQTCCPPTCSRTRVVNTLKLHQYKCPACLYRWDVKEPEIAQPAAPCAVCQPSAGSVGAGYDQGVIAAPEHTESMPAQPGYHPIDQGHSGESILHGFPEGAGISNEGIPNP